MIVIIDYGMGNLGSIRNMLRKIGAPAEISSRPEVLESADKLILPGVGAFDSGMRSLAEKGMIPLLNRRILEEKCLILGICLGMQLMTRESEEGNLPGLGWIAATTRRFRFAGDSANLKIPHMGWNLVKPANRATLFSGLEEPRFYFVHSYHVCCDDPADVLGTTSYGFEFTSAVKRDNIMGTQFHPEKSHKFGLKLLRNFVDLPHA